MDRKQNVTVSEDGIEVIDTKGYSDDVDVLFKDVPKIAKSLLKSAKSVFSGIEKMLYTAPEFIQTIKELVPSSRLEAILSDDQKKKIAEGALKLMTKKDGTLMANLINPETKKIVSTIPLEYVEHAPELSEAISNFSSQMQMAQIAEGIEQIQIAIEEVRQGQENDRLAIAYSCQQKLIQAMEIHDAQIKTMALLRIASDAEDGRNMLMLSQKENVKFIKEQPESFWGKLTSGAKPEKIEGRMNEIRESLGMINMVSLVEAMAYQEMGEYEAAKHSLGYYAEFLLETYLSQKGLVERLDLIDKSPENYWSKTLPVIHERIQALPSIDIKMIEKAGV